jgi:ribosomal protein L15
VILEDYKILGKGEIKDKFIVKAKSFSKQAKEKIEKAGGKAIFIIEKSEENKKEIGKEER